MSSPIEHVHHKATSELANGAPRRGGTHTSS
eukprot:CAMPEP_0204156350 /NCGR_PEP_ID=MMETSP0361-20130328/30364_1 /ASSEMBLY_ACC=CAM_ASM_000343 /TAXON_ID=268821 /ORGANISM="Scrippsiella Hangoei, Strain SHTV-5" /LENGTH=30 /DNA_ID= /DNA_START= /DNA_END= /DNA_ORIENTATION=